LLNKKDQVKKEALTDSLVNSDMEQSCHNVNHNLLGDLLFKLGASDQPEVVEMDLWISMLAIEEANEE